ncbi:zinc-dependent alcohol dehydrogenase family protein [Sphingomonas oligophenolica]|uniref:Zinc-dependent alcohol dehydrogenase family protein n=1 Tax=Sphingomonas oligophenolica TaxID=301154 RepID=A0ABU9Y0E0_9SPHN
MTSSSMIAAVVETHDGPFHLRDVALPQPGAGEVLVRVHASGTNPLDIKIRAGLAAHARNPLPATLGLDMAGTIERVGADVRGFVPGDEVYGMIGGVGGLPGTHAEYAVADARLIAHKPANLSMREAAVLPLVAITAWEGLIDRAQLRPGQTVLVQGGAGGVGHAVVQLALARGATVSATALGGDDLAYLERLGAAPIDGGRDVADYVRAYGDGNGFDIVYDTGGGALLDASFHAVRRFGHVVSSLGWGQHLLAPLSFRQASYSGVFTLQPLIDGEGRGHFGEILAELTTLVEQGKLLPRLDPREFTLATLAEAYAALEARDGAGKIAITATT